MVVKPGGLALIRDSARRTAVLGAVLVFLTFIVRDEVRENAKDRLASLEAAEARMEMAFNFVEMNDRFDSVSLGVNYILEDMIVKNSSDKKYSFTRTREIGRDFVRQQASALGETLSSSAELANDLPNCDDNISRLNELQTTIENFKSQLNTSWALSSARSSESGDDLLEMRARVVINRIEKEIIAFQSELVSQTKIERDRLRDQYFNIDVLSLILFAAGWVIGLSGQLRRPASMQDAA